MRYYLIITTQNFEPCYIQKANTITEARELFEQFNLAEIKEIEVLSEFQAGQLLVDENLSGFFAKKHMGHSRNQP